MTTVEGYGLRGASLAEVSNGKTRVNIYFFHQKKKHICFCLAGRGLEVRTRWRPRSKVKKVKNYEFSRKFFHVEIFGFWKEKKNVTQKPALLDKKNNSLLWNK